MDKKLTLSLNAEIIEKAKKHAKRHKTSLSRMVESYLAKVTHKEQIEEKFSPLVERLIGIIPLPKDFNEKEAIQDYLIEKYK